MNPMFSQQVKRSGNRHKAPLAQKADKTKRTQRLLVERAVRLFLLTALLHTSGFVFAQQIRVLTYNIRHGEDINGKLDLQQIAGVINRLQPDVVALQEVDSSTNRTQKVDQLNELAVRTGMRSFYGKSMNYDGGGYGVGILSRLPITDSFVLHLPGFPNSEPRVVATVEVQGPGKKKFLFSSVHLDHVDKPAERMEQAKKIAAFFSATSKPSILAGDFNAQPEEATLKDILFPLYEDTDPSGRLLTFPADQPEIKIDYVLVSKKHRWKKLQYVVVEEKQASDHRPVLSVLELR